MSLITIRMSERRPLVVSDLEWPVLLEAWDQQGAECIRVRQRGSEYIVYSNGRAGFIAKTDDDLIRSIRRVAGILNNHDLGTQAVEALPHAPPEPGEDPSELLKEAMPHVPQTLYRRILAYLAGT